MDLPLPDNEPKPEPIAINDADDLEDALSIWEDLVEDLRVATLPKLTVEYKLN
jgi:hypothetical protein